MNTLEILQNRLNQQKKKRFNKTLTLKRAEEIANWRLGGTWAVARDTRRLNEAGNLVKDMYGLYYETTSLLGKARIKIRNSGETHVFFPIKKWHEQNCPELYNCGVSGEIVHRDYIAPAEAINQYGDKYVVAKDFCLAYNYIFLWDDGTLRTYAPPRPRIVSRYHCEARPKWWSSAQGMGMELEINSNDRNKLAGKLNNEILIEHDGSLDANLGVELIGGPYTLAHYQNGKTPWNDALTLIKDIGGAGFHAGELYGIHISLTKSLFTTYHGAKFVLFFNQQAELCQLVGQRKQIYGVRDSDGFHNRKKMSKDWVYCESSGRKEIVIRDKNGRVKYRDPVLSYGGNYSVVGSKEVRNSPAGCYHNIETGKYEPVKVDGKRYEVRIFRSNLRWERILKNIEFVDAVRVYTQTASAKSVSTPFQGTADFLFWLGKQPGYATLKKFLVDNAKNFPDNTANFKANQHYKSLSQLVSFKINPKLETISDL